MSAILHIFYFKIPPPYVGLATHTNTDFQRILIWIRKRFAAYFGFGCSGEIDSDDYRKGRPKLDDCPYCKGSYEIAAIKFSIMQETTLLFACTSCGLARVEAPRMSKNWPKIAPRFAVALGLMITAPIALYVTIQILAFEHRPTHAGKLANAVEQSRGHAGEFHTHQPL